MQTFRKIGPIALLILVTACQSPGSNQLADAKPAAKGQTSVPAGDTTIIDVRTPDEYASGHIKGAINIDYLDDAFETEIAKLDPAKPYLLYCRSGHRSGEAKSLMMEKGFKQVSDINGGISAWKGEIVQ